MKKTATKKPKTNEVRAGKHRIVGDVVVTPLEAVKPNDWNPNVMTPFMMQSMRAGLLSDGWLKSKSLLVWGTDEKGKKRDVIIDGEHRWTAARELGFTEGPMVFLHGLTEAAAKALTIKMNRKRGEFDPDELGALIRAIQHGLEVDNLALELGIDESIVAGHLVLPEPEALPTVEADLPAGRSAHVKMVQLLFNEAQHEEFMSGVLEFSRKYGKKNVTDTVLEVLRHV